MGQYCACLNSEIGQQEINNDHRLPSPRPVDADPVKEADTLELSLSQPPRSQTAKLSVPPSAPSDLHQLSVQGLTYISEVPESQTSFLQCVNSLLGAPSESDDAQNTWQKPMQLMNGAVYTGEWDAKWRRHGHGMEVMPDGTKYVGYFRKGHRHGKGQLTRTNGQRYDGSFQQGKASGYGHFVETDGSEYKGQFKDDLQHGEGVETYANGSWYKGEFCRGHKEGRGTFTWADGSVYTGQFQDNRQWGKGTMHWANGKVYTGDWVRGRIQGTGKFQWPDGRHYVGQYVNDKKEGTGTLTWPSGKVFEGQWKAGVQHGPGTLTTLVEDGTSEQKHGVWAQGRLVRWV